MTYLISTTVYIFFLLATEAYAYVGPGLGLGAIGAFFGIIFAVILGIIGLIWYPLKKLFKKYKAKKQKNE